MNSLKFILIVIPIIAIIGSLHSQNVVKFTYDASGNRIKREKEIPTPTKSVITEPSVFTEEFAERTIKIYPNPTQGFLKVELSDFDNLKTVSLNLLNMQGQSILKTKMKTNPVDLDISNKPNGVYILQIIIDGKISTWKIIKE